MSMLIKETELQQYDRRYRVNLINSISGFKSANLIGSQDVSGVTNLALFSSAFHIGTSPPLLGLLSRPDTVPRDTLTNIKATGEYTLNHVHGGIIEQAHQTSARLASEKSEFDQFGLTPHYQEGFLAPFVRESRLQVGLKLVDVQTIKANDTQLIIGEVVTLSLPEGALLPSGNIDCEALGSVVVSGLDTYHLTQKQMRLAYAKADLPVRKIED